MRFKARMELEQGLKQIDIVPLINVIFLLLIFFMLTSGLAMQPPGIKVNLPKAVTSEIVKYENLEIIVSGENAVYSDGKPVTTQELKSLFIQAGRRGSSILIKADKAASLGRVVEIWDMARNSKVSQINLATNQE